MLRFLLLRFLPRRLFPILVIVEAIRIIRAIRRALGPSRPAVGPTDPTRPSPTARPRADRPDEDRRL